MRFISTGKTFHGGDQHLSSRSPTSEGQSGPMLPITIVIANICLWFRESQEVPLKSICFVAKISPPE